MKKANRPVAHICYAEDMHPYECGQDCIHCDRRKTKEHNPKTCVLCNWGKEGVHLHSTSVKRFPVNQKDAVFKGDLIRLGKGGKVYRLKKDKP